MWQNTRIIQCIVYTLAGVQLNCNKCIPALSTLTHRHLQNSSAAPSRAPPLPRVPAASFLLSLSQSRPVLGASRSGNHEMSVMLCLANFTSQTIFQAHRVLQQILAFGEECYFRACTGSLFHSPFARPDNQAASAGRF